MVRKVLSFTLLVAAILLVANVAVLGQDDWEKNDGEIEDVEVEIVKNREIKLPFANRNFEKIPPNPVDQSKPKLEYQFQNVDYSLKGLDVRVRPLKVKDDGLRKTYGNYLKAGVGNFATPYLEALFNNKRNKEYSYGLHFRHLSSKNGPVDKANSGSANTAIKAFGKAFTKSATLSGEAGFSNRKYHFYGYQEGLEVEKDTIEQSFNHFFAGANIASSKEGAKLLYNLGGSFDFINDKFSAKESEADLLFKGRYILGEKTSINISSDAAFITRKDEGVSADTRILFKFKPTFSFIHEGFDIEAGFNVAFENDTLGKSDQLHFYPYGKASYEVFEDIKAYAGIRGDMQKTSLRYFVNENPFLAPSVGLNHTNRSFDLFGGLEGKLSNNIGVHAGLSVANFKNMYFYINNPDNPAKFDIVYDEGNTSVFNLFAELTFHKEEKIRILGRADYFGYGTDNITEAWHKPNYKVTVLSSFNLFDKLVFGADLYLMGGIEAFDPVSMEKKQLDAAFDMNLKTEYLFSKRASAFISLNNIFSNEYELLNNYPVRGFQVLAGLTYNF